MNLAEFWPQCLALLAAELSEQQYQKTIAPLTVGEENGQWIVFAPTQFAANLLRSQHSARLEQARQLLAPETMPLAIKVGKGTHYEAAVIANPEVSSSEISATESSLHFPEKSPISGSLEIENPSINHVIHPTLEITNSESKIEKPKKINSAQKIIAKNLSNPRRTSHQESSPIEVASPAPSSSAIAEQKRREQEDLRFKQTNLNPNFTFESFVEGNSNRLALLAAQTMIAHLGERQTNPLFLYGNPGLGKTHLAQAAANQLLELHPEKRVYYIPATEYVSTFAAYARDKNWEAFTQRYQAYDLLIIDDVQYFSGKEGSMAEFFKLFEHFHSRHQQIILTCDQLPDNLEKMDQRLISRFNGGMTVRIEPPELETRMLILMKKAQMQGVTLQEDAAFFIAQHVKVSVRDLEGALNRLAASAKLMKSDITKDLAAKILEDIIVQNYKPVTLDWIMLEVANFYKITTADLMGSKRTRSISRPRQIAMCLAKELLPKLSLPAIGTAFGKRDHTTVMHAVKTVTELRNTDPEIKMDYEKLRLIFRTASD